MINKKVLIFHPSLAPYRVDFFNKISENFDSKFFFESRNVRDQKFDQQELISLCNFNINYLDNGFEFLNRSFRFGHLFAINNFKPQLVICSEYSLGTLMTIINKFFFRKKYKIIIMSDDSIDNSIKRRGLRKVFRNYFSKIVDGIILPSDEVCDWHKNNIDKTQKLFNLPIIHSDEVFRKKVFCSLKISLINFEKYNLKDKKIIIFVGRLVEVKNIDLLIKAFSKLDNSNCVLVIVGEGTQHKKLINLVKKLNIFDKTIFTGRLEGLELYSWFLISQLFVLPSTFEPFGAVINEALLSGCEVLCSDKAGASSLINKHNGLLFNPYSVDDLAEKIKFKLKNIPPLQKNEIKLKENKMPFTFDEKIDLLIKNLSKS